MSIRRRIRARKWPRTDHKLRVHRPIRLLRRRTIDLRTSACCQTPMGPRVHIFYTARGHGPYVTRVETEGRTSAHTSAEGPRVWCGQRTGCRRATCMARRGRVHKLAQVHTSAEGPRVCRVSGGAAVALCARSARAADWSTQIPANRADANSSASHRFIATWARKSRRCIRIHGRRKANLARCMQKGQRPPYCRFAHRRRGVLYRQGTIGARPTRIGSQADPHSPIATPAYLDGSLHRPR